VQATVDTLSRVKCEVDVIFQKALQLDFWVPARMNERCFDGAFLQQGEVTYDHYRKFKVDRRESLEPIP